MKNVWIPLFLAAICSCTSKPEKKFDQLVATAGPIPVAMEHRLTDEDMHRLRRHYPNTLERICHHDPLLLQDIINLTRAGVSDDVIIHEIHVTRSSFYLTPENEKTLQQAGISKRVIDEMLDTTNDHY